MRGDFFYGQSSHVADYSAGQQAAGAEEGEIEEQAGGSERHCGDGQLADIVRKASGAADADEGEAAGLPQSGHDGKA